MASLAACANGLFEELTSSTHRCMQNGPSLSWILVDYQQEPLDDIDTSVRADWIITIPSAHNQWTSGVSQRSTRRCASLFLFCLTLSSLSKPTKRFQRSIRLLHTISPIRVYPAAFHRVRSRRAQNSSNQATLQVDP